MSHKIFIKIVDFQFFTVFRSNPNKSPFYFFSPARSWWPGSGGTVYKTCLRWGIPDPWVKGRTERGRRGTTECGTVPAVTVVERSDTLVDTALGNRTLVTTCWLVTVDPIGLCFVLRVKDGLFKKNTLFSNVYHVLVYYLLYCDQTRYIVLFIQHPSVEPPFLVTFLRRPR